MPVLDAVDIPDELRAMFEFVVDLPKEVVVRNATLFLLAAGHLGIVETQTIQPVLDALNAFAQRGSDKEKSK
jgi:hypothetical protein